VRCEEKCVRDKRCNTYKQGNHDYYHEFIYFFALLFETTGCPAAAGTARWLQGQVPSAWPQRVVWVW
jgi:hypothetical protein